MSVNKVLLIGNLTSDATIRTVGQNEVASFTVATNERYRKADGTVGENTEFIAVELWGNSGVRPYLVKGAQVYVEGRLTNDRWTDQNGQAHERTKVKSGSIRLLSQRQQETHVGGTKFNTQAPQYSQPTYSAPVVPQAPAPATPPAPPAQPAQPAYVPPYGAVAQPPRPTPPAQPQGAPANFSDDIPF